MTMKKPILFSLFAFLGAATALAQGGGPPNPPGPVDDVPTPIDDHIWIILLVGLVFGLYLVLSKKSALKD
ncbi:hypothetical protein [Psychroflexus montanilacus]|uniref:hypothetical protein n=1 Tax=Psychroflexus montanilacus TaxID=2873598 RepID=UPI001CCFB55B|nr:hypothetical protein [Psychroflexus montanilacus]MBZ9652505.1 hypothetical protein [Psychroflexus montanilacus]